MEISHASSGLPAGGRSQRQRAAGKGRYPLEWDRIAWAVKTWAGWRCEHCGHPHELPSLRSQCDSRCSHPVDGKQRVLTVHHLNMDPAECALWNLVALCQACHLSIQSRVDWHQGWLSDLPTWTRSLPLPAWANWRRRRFVAIWRGV